jgi:hypothetical protein
MIEISWLNNFESTLCQDINNFACFLQWAAGAKRLHIATLLQNLHGV